MKTVLLTPWYGGTPRRLAQNLNLLRRSPDEYQKDRGLRGKVGLIVNWGCRRVLGDGVKMLNPASSVAVASNKLTCLRKLHEKVVPSLEYTLERKKADDWLKTTSVVGHFNLHAHSAQGLELFKKGSDIKRDDIVLYTRYFPKKVEARVHCIRQPDGKYKCLYLEKGRVLEGRWSEFDLTETPQTYIRTWDNGWIFKRNVNTDLQACNLASKAMEACGLEYGAVDIMHKDGEYVVGEINTAPGLEGQCLSFYVANLGSMIERNNR